MHIKAKSMTQFDIFIPLWQIQWTQSYAFSELYSKQPKSEICQKMPMFEQLSSSNLKIIFDPSLERSWCEFFRIIEGGGPKNPPPSNPGV